MLGAWIKSLFNAKSVKNPPQRVLEKQTHPEGLEPVTLAQLDLDHIELETASEFLRSLTLEGLKELRFGNLRRTPLAQHRSFKAGRLSYTDKGLTIVMKKNSKNFDITFSDLWTKLRALGVKDAKKMLIDNAILWSWRWEFDEVVCKVSYWNSLGVTKDEGVKFTCQCKPS
ncbi:MAG: hypothetical protein A2527_08570 [Candidatus Lambdaproteobacteria bacterium RIFOXYD2_FULL_50_16]|uniref:Uncharacterized protein n=1 Tax=Candidatus Lambdaproteobacteria bacterium RIFOXYD2_FULL_50_16 TaxID=1817772 RepID=A0A1F6GAT7_9PROT|nr:MAG: hypothetical protein A2527_08570 [Candidatus Lambdaproteobacteria bacterium RIFOXYD2_FULL_50_16]